MADHSVRAAGLPSGAAADERPTPYLEGARRSTRSSRVVVVQPERGDWAVVFSLCTDDQTRVVRLDQETGTPRAFGGARGRDVFASEGEALESLNAESSIAWTLSARALLGLVPLPDAGTALLLLATRTRVSVTLPGGHEVQSVAEAVWVKMPLSQRHELSPLDPAAQAAAALLSALLEYPVEGAHFYCETADVSRPWAWAGAPRPSAAAAATPLPEFTWNHWLASPLAACGLPPGSVPPLHQGMAESRLLSDALGARFAVALLARRGRLHPGTRYIARGLNAEESAPGNEVECEQLMWRLHGRCGAGAPAEQPPQAWSSCVWRRGTVPIHWGQEIRSTVGEAEMYVQSSEPYAGTEAYFSRLVANYTPPPGGAAAAAGGDGEGEGEGAGEAAAPPPPVLTCINLLRQSLKSPETLLTEHFQEAVKLARRAEPARLAQLRLLNFDWHGNVKALGEAPAVEGLWSLLGGACEQAGTYCGTTGFTDEQQPLPQPLAAAASAQPAAAAAAAAPAPAAPAAEHPLALPAGGVESPPPAPKPRASLSSASLAAAGSPAPPPPGHCVRGWQRGVLRYNCADSLDRTNLASFFGAAQMLLVQAQQLDLVLEAAGGGGGSTGLPRRSSSTGPASLWPIQRSGSSGGLAAPEAGPPPLPPGWESRVDAATGNVFYIDHNRKTTTWTRPAPAQPPPPASPPASPRDGSPLAQAAAAAAAADRPPSYDAFGRSVEDVRSRLLPSVAAALTELFQLNGDVHAALYTGSRALNSGMMHMLDAGGARRRGVVGSSPAASTATQIGISVQRRFVNLTLDSSRQLAFEAFLGLSGAAAARRAREEAEPPAVTHLVPPAQPAPPSAAQRLLAAVR